MPSSWEMIPQTHRTILFEEFTHAASTEAVNLYDILNSFDDPEDEELYKEIKQRLEVRSFAEFLEKFQPRVYEYAMGSVEDPLPRIYYTINPMEAKQHNAREIELTKHTYYEMLVNMYQQKADSGVADIEFNDAEIRKILTPQREMEKLYDTRRQIPLLMERYDAKVAKNENATKIAKQLIAVRKDAVSQISQPTALMAIGLDDANRQLEAIDKKLLPAATSSAEDGKSVKLISGRGGFDEEGRWILIPAKTSASDSGENTDSPSDPRGDNQKKFALIVQKDLNERASSSSTFTKNLIVSAYTGMELDDPLKDMDSVQLAEYRGRLVERKKSMETVFTQAKESFIQALSENVRKLLSVKIFFDHATIKGGDEAKLPKDVGLIVANCTANKLLNLKDKFAIAMKHLSNPKNKDRLWFAILPHVIDEDFTDSVDEVVDYSGNWDTEDLEDDNAARENGTDFNAAKALLKIMENCKVMTVFNFAPTANTTFSGIKADVIEKIQSKLEPVSYEHAIYALPNFTIMRSGSVPLSKEPNAPTISVPAMYIDASYVAAGLLVVSQQPEFWIKCGFKDGETFTRKNACVRIDFESDEITSALLTKFNRERSIAWSEEITNAFTKSRFGFVFDGDRRYDSRNGKFINNTYVLNARTLRMRDSKYQQIFRTLTKDFIETYLSPYQITPTEITPAALKSFLKDVVSGEWKRESGRTPNSINLLLRGGEDISQEGSDLKVKFLDGEDTITITVTE